MKELSRFLRIDDNYSFSPESENQAYVIKNKHINTLLKDPKDPLHKIGSSLARIIPEKHIRLLKKRIAQSNLKEEKYPPMDKQLENTLREKYLGEVQMLEIIMGRDLSSWYGK
jgi:hypothetical protein